MKNQWSFINGEEEDETQFDWWRKTTEFKDPNGILRQHHHHSILTNMRLKVLREMERLTLIGQEGGVDEVRQKLITYKSGDFWLPVGGIKKEDMEIQETICVLLVGLSASGKSSLINLMYSLLGRSGLIPFSQTSNGCRNYTTMFLEEHNVLRSTRSGFCVYDSRGLDFNQIEEGLEEVSRWMTAGIRHNQPCLRRGDQIDGMLNSSWESFEKRKVNYVAVVVDLAGVYKAFFSGGDFKPILAVKKLFHSPSIRTSNENPLLILTHGDTLLPEERINGRIKICEYLGIPATTGAYDIACLTEHGILPEESDPTTSFALCEAVYRALLQSDRTHVPKRTYKNWILDYLARVMGSLASFFAMLSRIFSEWSHKQKLKF